MDARPWDFQAEECTLRTCVDRFINRRYLSGNLGAINRGTAGMTNTNGSTGGGGSAGGTGVAGVGNNGLGSIINDLNEYDHNLLDINVNNVAQGDKMNYAPGYGGWDETVELSEEFKEHYEVWLQQEVFNTQINWDSLAASVEC